MPFIGANVIVRGMVQGVGFRYYCLRRVAIYNLTGYVANLPDGTVELEIEGERSMIEEYLKEVKVGPSNSNVTDIQIEWYAQPKGYKSFNIEYK